MKGEDAGQTRKISLNLTVHIDSNHFIFICHSLYKKGFAKTAETKITFWVDLGATRSQTKKQKALDSDQEEVSIQVGTV